MKRFGRRLNKLEELFDPRGKNRRPDEEVEKHFLETMERIKSMPDVTEGHVQVFLKLFEIEKEQARKEERPLETWWNVLWLGADDPMDYERRQRVKLRYRVPPLSEEHRERVKELLTKVGHPLAKTM